LRRRLPKIPALAIRRQPTTVTVFAAMLVP
jgi:hypothetical protein